MTILSVRSCTAFHFQKLMLLLLIKTTGYDQQATPVVTRGMANATGAIIELSNYLEQRISQKSAEFAAVSDCATSLLISR